MYHLPCGISEGIGIGVLSCISIVGGIGDRAILVDHHRAICRIGGHFYGVIHRTCPIICLYVGGYGVVYQGTIQIVDPQGNNLHHNGYRRGGYIAGSNKGIGKSVYPYEIIVGGIGNGTVRIQLNSSIAWIGSDVYLIGRFG